MVSVTNPLMDSEIWGAKLAGKCVVCWSNKAVAPHPTISAVPLPDATLARLIRPTSSRTSPPPEVLILMGYKCKKSLIVEQAFRIWSVIEDYSPLRGSPCGPLLAQRSLASLESNLPAPGGSHPHGLQMQKSLLAEQAFRIWSVIEDSNLRPLRPERSALPGCANHRMRGASYCADTPSSIP